MHMMTTTIRPCRPSDAPRICTIYNHFVTDTVVTFEEQVVSDSEMAQRITSVTEQFPWLVCEKDDLVVGYAYANTWKTRSAYRFSVESTIYLAPEAFHRGIGTSLYQALLAALRASNIHSVIGGIALPNAASVALHEKLGFSKIGQFSEVGWKFGRWVDVGYWEHIL
jgi:L-amino acid N-acyltransferase YncA